MINDTKVGKKNDDNKLIKSEKNKNNKIPKEISQQILKKMFRSLLKAVCITLYFIILNLAYTAMKEERLVNDVKVFSGVFLIVGIYFIEKAYKNDSGIDAISGIEFLVLSLHSLSIMHIITLFKYDFRLYLLTSSYIFSIYFVLKAIILYTKGRKEYLQGLSDISEIVKKDEPVRKEARKRTPEEMERKLKHKKEKEEEINTTIRKKKKKKKKVPSNQVVEKEIKHKKEETKRPVKKTTKSKEIDKKEETAVKKKKTVSKSNKKKISTNQENDELPKRKTKKVTSSKREEIEEEKPKTSKTKKTVKKKKIE